MKRYAPLEPYASHYTLFAVAGDNFELPRAAEKHSRSWVALLPTVALL